MSTARQRRRKGGRRSKRRQNRKADLVAFNLRQRVTMEVARLANALGMTMQVAEPNGQDLWIFYGPDGRGLLDYRPISGAARTTFKGFAEAGYQLDVRKVLAMAAAINNERR